MITNDSNKYYNELLNYTTSISKYTPYSNLLSLDRNIIHKLGSYIINNINISKVNELSYIKSREGYDLLLIAVTFFTTALNEHTLKDLLGDPLLHSEFGEGFEYYNKTTGNSNTLTECTFASYFIKINNTKIHIGYDVRGTIIEIGINDMENLSKVELNDTVKVLETLVDLYKNKYQDL